MERSMRSYWVDIVGTPEWFLGWRLPEGQAHWRLALTHVFQRDCGGTLHVPALYLSPALHFVFDDEELARLCSKLADLPAPTLASTKSTIGVSTIQDLKQVLLLDRPARPASGSTSPAWLEGGTDLSLGALPADAIDGRSGLQAASWTPHIAVGHLENWSSLVQDQLGRELDARRLGVMAKHEPWLLFDDRILERSLSDLWIPAGLGTWDRRVAAISHLWSSRDQKSSTRSTSSRGRRRGNPATATTASHLATSLLFRLLDLQNQGQIPARSPGIRRLYHTVLAVLDPTASSDVDRDDGKARQRARRMADEQALRDGVAPLLIPLHDDASRIPAQHTGPTAQESLSPPLELPDGDQVHSFLLGDHAPLARWASERLAKLRSSEWLARVLFVLSGGAPDMLDIEDAAINDIALRESLG